MIAIPLWIQHTISVFLVLGAVTAIIMWGALALSVCSQKTRFYDGRR